MDRMGMVIYSGMEGRLKDLRLAWRCYHVSQKAASGALEDDGGRLRIEDRRPHLER
jgi:hypothetical protein